MTSQEEYDSAYNYDPDFWGNPEPQEPKNEETGNALGLRITFLDRRKDFVRRSYPFPTSHEELDTFWAREWLLTRAVPGYILYPSEQNERKTPNEC